MRIISFLILGLILLGCKVDDSKGTDQKLRIVCTTSMIADGIQNIVTDDIEVLALMGAGVDPHLYDPRPSDLKALDKADVIIYNGFHLEGKFIDKFEKLRNGKTIIALSDFIKEKGIINPDFVNSVDPHFWHNPLYWSQALNGASLVLQQIAEENSAQIKENTTVYSAQIEKAYQEIKEDMLRIPEENRILITSHDAFHYFGNCYGLKIKPLQGISTLSESGLKQVSDLAQFIIKNKVSSIFVESSVSHRSLESVRQNCAAQGYTVKIAEELFSDALGEEGGVGGTYLGMIRENAKRIKKGLSHE